MTGFSLPGLRLFDVASNDGGQVTAQPGARAGVPQVMFHGFDAEGAKTNDLGIPTIDGPINATEYVSQLSWTHSTRAPFETIDLTLSMPESAFQRIIPGPLVGDQFHEDGARLRQPSTGFWVVLYLPNDDSSGNEIWSAIHWGVCTRLVIRGQANQDTGAKTLTVQISCESWVSVLQRNTVCMAPASSFIRDGYSYDLRQWSDELSALLQGSLNQMPGEVFQKLWYSMTPQIIPTSLSSFSGQFASFSWDGQARHEFGGNPFSEYSDAELSDLGVSGMQVAPVVSKAYTFGDAINFVWNREDAMSWCPNRALNHKAVTGWGLGSIGTVLPRGTTWSMWSSTFFPIPAIECFPSMEWPHFTVAPYTSQVFNDTVYAASAYAEASVAAVLGTQRQFYEVTLEELEALPDWEGGLSAQLMTSSKIELVPDSNYLSSALGRSQPCLIYRMKPAMFTPLNSLELTDATRRRWGGAIAAEHGIEELYHIEAEQTKSQKVGLNQRTQVVAFHSNVGPQDPIYTWSADQVYNFEWVYSENDRVNATYAKTPLQPMSQLELHGLLGHPIVDDTDVAKHGLRMQTQDWPFLAPGIDINVEGEGQEGTVSLGTLSDRLTAQGEELFCTVANSDTTWVFGQGSLTGVYKPWAKAGMFTRVLWETRGNRWIPYNSSPSEEGQAEKSDAGHPGFVGYCHTVSHQITVDQTNGTVRASTVMQLERLSPALGGGMVPITVPISAKPRRHDGAPFIVDRGTGQRITGSITANDDGTISFTPDPVPGA